MTERELRELTLDVYKFREGWVVIDHNHDVKSVHRTQAEASERGRTIAKRRAGRLVIRGRNGLIRKQEIYWSGPVRFEPLKPVQPSVRPNSATRKAISAAMTEAIRIVNARAAQQNN